MPPILGIDLGTTNSAAAVMERGNPVVIPMSDGKFTLPSMVAFLKDQRLVGESAKRQFANNVSSTVFAAKRFMGRSFQDAETQKAMQAVGYTCVEGPNGDVWVSINDQKLAIPEISALILSEIKKAAEHHFNCEVNKAVITVPAYFNDRQRQATRQAAQIAGLDVLRIINEPTAAALAYGIHQGAERKVAVYDLGGGTFDVSVLKVGGGTVEVLASDGDAFLGGHDFDHRVFEWLVAEIEREHGVNARMDAKAAQRLREAAEAAKIRLSDEESTRIALPFLMTTPKGDAIHFQGQLTRIKFEELVKDLVERTIDKFRSTLTAAKLTPEDIDDILLVGGMTFTPMVRRRVEELTGTQAASGVHPDLVVAVGAAVQSALLTDDRQSAVLLDVTPHNLGILTVANLAEMLIPKNAKVPTSIEKRFTTVRDNQDTVKIVVYQGDSRTINKNQILGEFRLEGIRPAPRGEVQIDVSFSISADGDVQVSAKDVESGRSQQIHIGTNRGIPEQDLKKMIARNRPKAKSL